MNKQQLKKLQQKWYKKLKDSGFEDAETEGGTLKEFASLNFLRKSQVAEKQRYYELARQMVHDFPFSDNRLKSIWKLHAEGVEIEEIARHIKVSTATVDRAIRSLARYINRDID